VTSNSSNGTTEESTPLQARVRPGSAIGFVGGGGRREEGSEDSVGMGERRMSEDREKEARVQRKVFLSFSRERDRY
jgi:hypothetical protein